MSKRKWFEIRNQGNRPEILIYGDIGRSFWNEDVVSANDLITQLKEIGDVPEIDVRIHSAGGDVFEASAIYTALKANDAKINVYIDGLAASAASYVALAGDHIVISEAGWMMIHEAWGWGVGTAAELRKDADRLETITGTIADLYANRTDESKDEVLSLMSEDTWFNAQDSVDFGLADEVFAGLQAVASIRTGNRSFNNMPDEVRAFIKNGRRAQEVPVNDKTRDDPDTKQPETGTEAGRNDSAAIVRMCNAVKRPDLAEAMITEGLNETQAKARLFDTLADESDKLLIDNHHNDGGQSDGADWDDVMAKIGRAKA